MDTYKRQLATDLVKTDCDTPRFCADSPFLQDIGAELVAMSNGCAELALILEKRHLNSWQAMHGGVIMTLLDVAMSMAGRSLNPEARSGVTVDMHVSFLQPAGQAGERIIARAQAFHRATTMVFCEGTLWNGENMTAKAMGTFKYLKRLDAGVRIG